MGTNKLTRGQIIAANVLFYLGGAAATYGLYQIHQAFAFIVGGVGAAWFGYRIHRG